MENIYTFWKNNPNLWFSSTPTDDKYISETFINYLDNDYNIDNIDIINWTSYCILHDQLIKHFNRHYKSSFNSPNNFIENCYKYYDKFKNDLNDFEFMFMLMPIRHTHILNHVRFVLDNTWKRLNNNVIKKYLVATYERYIKCSPDMDFSNIVKYENPDYDINFLDILDTKCSKFNNKMNIINNNSNLIQIMKKFIDDNKLNDKLITVSISGGVDSMVCSYLLKLINHPFILLHIDYYNRAECYKEEELLKWWCNQLDVPLYIRRIDEINRPKCMEHELRDLYETYTKNIRFNSYITINNINNTEPYIMLGHNKDDSIENIFTNIASNSHYENLLGMSSISNQTHFDVNINIIRPLLTIMKKEIYDFAIINNIPFLVDSTPKWSQRGKIRDIVRPALEEWNPLIIEGLINLSNKMNDMNKLINTIIKPEQIFNNIDEVPIDSTYWNIVFKKYNLNVTLKTMKCFIEKIQFLQKYPHKLQEKQLFTLCKNHLIEFKQKDKLFLNLSNIYNKN